MCYFKLYCVEFYKVKCGFNFDLMLDNKVEVVVFIYFYVFWLIV